MRRGGSEAPQRPQKRSGSRRSLDKKQGEEARGSRRRLALSSHMQWIF
jgi:hypothetical protein